MMDVSATFPMVFGVILYFYFRNVFENKALSKKDLLHLIPFLLAVLLLLPQYLSTAAVKLIWMTGGQAKASVFHWPFQQQTLIRIFPWIKIVHMLIYASFISYSYTSLSKTNQEVSSWFNWLTGLFIAFIVSYASYYILVNFAFFNVEWDYMISFSMMFAIYFIAWFGYLQPKVFSGFTIIDAIRGGPRYKNSALNEDISQEILTRLNTLMHTEKVYRENDLRLEKLAGILSVSKHHLSQVINEQTEMNYFEYINHLRIEEAKELLIQKTKKELNIIEVAFMVGFNNKVSFNNTFKKIVGKTPTEFRNACWQEQEKSHFQ